MQARGRLVDLGRECTPEENQIWVAAFALTDGMTPLNSVHFAWMVTHAFVEGRDLPQPEWYLTRWGYGDD